jgi:hypothetical protein
MRGRPKLRRDVAEARGAAAKNPARYRDMPKGAAPAAVPIGEPSPFLNDAERECWRDFVAELGPRLAESDRAQVECMCVLRARVRETGDLKAMAELVRSSERAGGTPVSRGRMPLPADTADPADEFVS